MRTVGRLPAEASAIIMAGRPLSQVATAEHASPGRQRTHQAAQHDGGVIAEGQRVEHAGVPWVRPSQGSVQAPAKGIACSAFNSRAASATSRANLPVSGVKAEGDGGAVLSAQTTMGAEDEDLRAERGAPGPTHAGVLAQPEEIARGLGEQHLRRDRQEA